LNKRQPLDSEKFPEGRAITKLGVEPQTIKIDSPFRYAQVVVSATLDSGDVIDVTRLAGKQVEGTGVSICDTGIVRGNANASTAIRFSIGGQTTTVKVEVVGFEKDTSLSWSKDVNPAIVKMGCNAGTCHGAKDGKNGFKLSLRGYDPIYDIRAFTDDMASRRVNLASPDDSLMLLKATSAVPHEGDYVEVESGYFARTKTPGSFASLDPEQFFARFLVDVPDPLI